MTRKEFSNWCTKNNCSVQPVDGINNTGNSVKIINQKFPSEYTYLRLLPVDDRDMPDEMICQACYNLHIPVPPEIECED